MNVDPVGQETPPTKNLRCLPGLHVWQIVGKDVRWTESKSDWGGSSRRLWTYFVLRCPKCGRIRGKRLRGEL